MSGYVIDVICEIEAGNPWVDFLHKAAASTLAHEAIPFPAGLTLLLTNDSTLHELNRAFRDEDQPTDVLSFAYNGLAGPEMDNYLGDIAISVETAQQQAETAGHSLLDELCLLTVHGVLHLLGYDHDQPEAQEKMWEIQNQILASLA